MRRAAHARSTAAAPTGRPASQTPIPLFDVERLLDIFTSAIGDEEANDHVRRVELSASASAAQRRAHEATMVENEATGEREHKETLMAREQYEDADDKAEPGRLRYRHASRMAIVSEDEAAKTGFWHGAVYQFHNATGTGHELQTKAGPLPLEGVLKVGYARIAEIRKGVGRGSVAHPRLSVRYDDAARCEAVLTPLVLDEVTNVLSEDGTRPPLLVPLALLGCKVEVRELSSCDAYWGGEYELVRPAPTCGGPMLQMLVLDETTFAASAMEAGGELSFEQMKLPALKLELAARGSTRTGLKASLQRRLHGLLVQAAIAVHAAKEAEAAEAGERPPAAAAPDPKRARRGSRGHRGRRAQIFRVTFTVKVQARRCFQTDAFRVLSE